MFSIKSQKELSRTIHMQMFNRSLFFKSNVCVLPTDLGEIACVDRFTRNFNQSLLSVGSSPKRENILLSPYSPTVMAHYQTFKETLSPCKNKALTTRSILKMLCLYSANLFASRDVNDFIQQRINHPTCPQKLITLNAFMTLQKGVCRHSALLNACFLSKLIEDGLIEGTIIHHRQSFPQKNSSHTWVLFLSDDGRLYSLDSSYRKLLVVSTIPDLEMLDLLYKDDSVSRTIERRLRQLELIKGQRFIAEAPPLTAQPLKNSNAFADQTPCVIFK